MGTSTPEVQEGRAGAGLEQIGDFIDIPSLEGETRKAASRNRLETRPYRQYIKRVIETAGVPNVHSVRQLASNICGSVSRLPFVPDNVIKDEGGKTDYERQVETTAARAEELLGSEVVWTTAARKIARTALELRVKDPDGKKDLAWVNQSQIGDDGASVLDV